MDEVAKEEMRRVVLSKVMAGEEAQDAQGAKSIVLDVATRLDLERCA